MNISKRNGRGHHLYNLGEIYSGRKSASCQQTHIVGASADSRVKRSTVGQKREGVVNGSHNGDTKIVTVRKAKNSVLNNEITVNII